MHPWHLLFSALARQDSVLPMPQQLQELLELHSTRSPSSSWGLEHVTHVEGHRSFEKSYLLEQELVMSLLSVDTQWQSTPRGSHSGQ